MEIEKITKWLEEQNRDYEISDKTKEELHWLLQFRHRNKSILVGNPKDKEKCIEMVYKLNISDEHQKAIKNLNGRQRPTFENSLVALLSSGSIIYTIQRDKNKSPTLITMKHQLFEDTLTRQRFFDRLISLINIGQRVIMQFQSLQSNNSRNKETDTSPDGPSLYR